MLRRFEGPESPRPRPPTPPAGTRRTLLLGAAAAVVLTLVVGLWFAVSGSKPRKAVLSQTGPCAELRVWGRRYVARQLSPALLRRTGRLRSSATVSCGESTVRRARLVRLNGVSPGVAVARAAAPGLVYVVADSRCLHVRAEAELAACLVPAGAR